MMTTIENGVAVFGIWGAWDSYADRVEVNVRNLVSRDAAVHVIGAYDFADVEIDNVKVIDLAAIPGYLARIALFAHSHGHYIVKNSMVRMKPVQFDVPLEAGIGYSGIDSFPSTIGAELEFFRNSVATQQGTAILIEHNALAIDPKSVLIKRNELAGPEGISATDLHGACVLDKNTIYATEVGLTLNTVADSIVRQNTIDMAGDSFAGVHLHDVVSSKVRQNQVAGDAEFGLLAEGSSYGDNLVIGEGDMSLLIVTQAHLYLAAETHDNRLVLDDDEDLIIVDLGMNNTIDDDGDD
jgi:hypothetical protein